MRLCKVFMGTAVIFSSLSASQEWSEKVASSESRDAYELTSGSDKAGAESLPPPATSRVIAKDELLGNAYYDTVGILNRSNRCSDFFGGSAFAVHVFNEFVSRIRKEYASKNIGMRMTGDLTEIVSADTHKHFRLFDKVMINQDGPFYKRRLPLPGFSLSNVGRFDPGTREARTLMLLHELGHLIQGPDGQWLLPDDGKDEELSLENSRKIEHECDQELLTLGKATKPLLAARPGNLKATNESSDLGSSKRP